MILLIGGGDLLAKYARYIENKRDVKIISSRRMLDSILLNKKLLKEELNEIGVTCIEATSLDEYEVGKLMEESNITISFASPWIFRQEHIDKCRKIVNVHLTELPEWKGAASISWKLLCNSRKGGSTIHRLTNEIDKGEILFQDKYEIPEDLKKPIEWYRHTIAEAEKSIFKALDEIRIQENTVRIENSSVRETYFPRLNTALNGAINWNWKADEICRFICAFDEPYEGAWSRVNGKEKVNIKDGEIIEMNIMSHPFNAGLIISREDDFYTIATKDKYIKGRISSKTKLIGKRLITPRTELEQALYIPKINP